MSHAKIEFGLCLISDEAKSRAEASLKFSETSVDFWPVSSLGGGDSEYLVAGLASAHAVVLLLRAIYPYAELRKVKSIKVGETEIQNPSAADVDRLLTYVESVKDPAADGNSN